MRARAGRLVAGSLALAFAGCSPPAPVAPPKVEQAPAPIATATATAAAAPPSKEDEARKKVAAMLAKVAKLRGLPVVREVPGRVLNRDEVLAKIKAKVEKEIPPDVVEHEGELLAGLELVPPEYDFVEGTYRLIQGRIAGFYEPADHTMYLVDDLGDDEADETLAHELDHALQDQSFDLKKLLDFAPGDGDRTAAGHAVAEGDATSAMFDVTLGSAFNVPVEAMRQALALSNAVSETSAKTPHALQESLIAPYADGFAFVQAVRESGGWPAVDAAWRALPVSTEQLLHIDKYRAHEPPIAVAVPTFSALGGGFRATTNDVVGEQGLKIMLAEWAGEKIAATAAAGWGGDRYVVARRDDAKDRHTIAVGWHAVMDSDEDATELAAVLKKRFGTACRERPTMGPIAWQRKGRDLAVVAGPYQRQGKVPKSAGTCAVATRWVKEMLAQ
ncbi:Hypothetical protein A7982_09004 [Minicystis rosea]|nr:Hypothetical protein A7982_09004 [Minicystis rosea]